MAYTYLIGWKTQQKFYYGVRYARDSHPGDLWKTYFTSSKYVKEWQEKFGDPDIIEVRKTFSCPMKAREWEFKVLKRLNAIHSDNWLNKTNNKAIVFERSNEWKKKISDALKGRKSTFKGKKHTDESKELISKSKLGKSINHNGPITDTWKDSISKSMKGKVREQSKTERTKRSINAKGTFSKVNVGKVWMNDGNKSIRVKPEEIEKYQSSGFTRGRVKRRT